MLKVMWCDNDLTFIMHGFLLPLTEHHSSSSSIYRENSIAIESEAKDPFGGNVFYVTMQITLHIPEFARK